MTLKEFKKFIEENDIQTFLFEKDELTTELIFKSNLGTNIPHVIYSESYFITWKDWFEEEITPVTVIKSDMNNPKFLDNLTKVLKERIEKPKLWEETENCPHCGCDHGLLLCDIIHHYDKEDNLSHIQDIIECPVCKTRLYEETID